ncbi:hypothetical protein [Galbibacter sp. PAP.153]|uniref:hypothetical protein n=1 Tax=Galbibacter sp. PAP.153 TaxID=3104623 RepID=UPI003008FA6E
MGTQTDKMYDTLITGILFLWTLGTIGSTEHPISNYKVPSGKAKIRAIAYPRITGAVPKEFQLSLQKVPSSPGNGFGHGILFIKWPLQWIYHNNKLFIFNTGRQQTREQLTALLFPFHNHT